MWIQWVFIPAILGYACLSNIYTERYDLFRISGHHVFFRSAIAGYIVVLVAYITTLIYDLLEPNQAGSINRTAMFGEKRERGLTLSVSEIVSARFFDWEIYRHYQSKES